MNKSKSTVTILIMSVILVFFLSYPIKIIKNFSKSDGANSNYRKINYELLYPSKTKNKSSNNRSTILNRYKQISNKVTTKITDLSQENILLRRNILEVYGLINKYIGTKYIIDSDSTIIKSNDNNLTFKDNKINLKKSYESIINFNNYINNNTESKLIYIQLPSKKLNESDIIPGIIENKKDIYIDIIIKKLIEREIDVLDLRKKMPLDYEEYIEKFYITDHHWKIETAFEMTKYIVEFLNGNYNYEINSDLYMESKYNNINNKKIFLGSIGKKVTSSYIKAEDFKLITPNFENDINVYIPEFQINKNGTFDSLLNYKQLKGNIYDINPYACYTYGDSGLLKLNNQSGTDKKVLIIKDSSANPIISFLALGIKNIDVIDLRLFNGSLKSYLEENSYDNIIIMYNAYGETIDTINEKSLYNFKLI